MGGVQTDLIRVEPNPCTGTNERTFFFLVVGAPIIRFFTCFVKFGRSVWRWGGLTPHVVAYGGLSCGDPG